MSAATVAMSPGVRLGQALVGLGTFGKDLWRGVRIVGSAVGVMLLIDLSVNMMMRLVPGVVGRGFLGTNNMGGVIELLWLVTGYAVGLSLTCEEEESGVRTLLEQLPVSLQRHYWTKAIAGICLTLLFFPLMMIGYGLTRFMAPIETQAVSTLAMEALTKLGPGASVLLAVGCCMIGQAWAVFAKGNGPVAAVVGFLSTYVAYMAYFFVSGAMDRYSNINMTWFDVALGALGLGVAELMIASRRWTRPGMDRKGFLESLGIQITITRTRRSSLDWRIMALPTVVMAIVGFGVVAWLVNMPRSPLSGEWYLGEGLVMLGLTGAILGGAHGAWCLEPDEQQGPRFFLFYQPLGFRWFYLRRVLQHGVLAGLVGTVSALAILQKLPGTEWYGCIAVLAVSAAAAGLFVYTASAAFRLRLMSGGLGVVLALVFLVPATPAIMAISRVSISIPTITRPAILTTEQSEPFMRLLAQMTTVSVAWLCLVILVVPALLAYVLHHVARMREMTEGMRQVIGLLLVVQLVLVGPLLVLISPADLWIILFP
ncbi:hypothetical protein GC173_04230 [bacterium]|nr:hypothetical protein [bacterium]